MTEQHKDPNQASIESDLSHYPRATEAERLSGGARIEDIFGIFPPEAFEGFDEEIRALRRGFREA